MSEAQAINTDYLSEKDVLNIFKKCKQMNKGAIFKSYNLRKASDKMLGFLADYWKLEIQVYTRHKKIQSINFFIKSISTSNAAKAKMIKKMKLYDKEVTFYVVIKDKINLSDRAPWSANLVTILNEAMVFEDLNFLQYKIRNKFETFDEQHTFLALQTLARFHAGSIVYEEKKSIQLKKCYTINDEHQKDLDRGGYRNSDPWFVQCMSGALEAVKSFSKYSKNNKVIEEIESRWSEVWEVALDLSHFSFEYRNVITHRDLWNNNILFRYKEINETLVPDNCVLVDFQAVTCQPPAGDVMLLLYCNLDPKFREENINNFLNYYYRQLEDILRCNNVSISNIISVEDFLRSCEKYKLWGLVVSACLIPQFWIDDDHTTKYFCNTVSFEEILIKDKGSFIKKMIETSDNYKNKIMQVFEEIVDIYCLDETVVKKTGLVHQITEYEITFSY